MTLRQCLLFFVALTSFATGSLVILNPSGGYEKIVVAISPEVDRSKVESLLFRLEAIFAEASKLLQTATRGRFYFHEIVFVLPSSLSSIDKDFQEGRKSLGAPNFLVGRDALFEKPWTLQHGGCGQPGLRIIIPQRFLFEVEKNKAQSIVREWAHYRYGVFDESGFPNDTLYPQIHDIPGSENTAPVKVSDCTDKEATYEFRDNSGYLCEPNSSDCNVVEREQGNDLIVSSLMTKFNFPKVEQFCDDENLRHNRNSPTKQNALCRERSTWDVISQNQDFRFSRTRDFAVQNVNPTFKYVFESVPRFILAVDSSSNMGINDRMDMVRNAFAYFAFEDLPKKSSSGIVDLGRLDKEPLFLPLLTLEDAEALVDAFPDGDAAEVCVHCGILKAIQVLRLNSNHPVASGTLLVATSADIADYWSKNISTTLALNDVALFVIYFQDKSRREPPLLERLATSSGGKFFCIPEGVVDGKVESLAIIYESFRAVYQSFSWMMRNHVLVDQRTFHDDGTKHTMTFTVDKSIEKFQVLLTGPGFFSGPYGPSGPLVRDRIILRSGDDVYAPGNKSVAYKMKIPAYVFSIESPQEETWSFSFERKPGYKKPLTVLVRAGSEDQVEMINLQVIVSNPRSLVNTTRTLPHTIHAVVNKGMQPITNAKVTAHVLEVETGRTFVVELHDNGNGDPDVTENDGIYSRYFTDILFPGYHLLTVVADSEDRGNYYNISTGISAPKHCCGSVVPQELAYQPGRFKRMVISGGFYVTEVGGPDLDHPPGRIADLRVTDVRVLEHNVQHYTLRWTAPGSDYDSGTAAFYELKVFQSRDDAIHRFSSSEVLTIDMWRVHGSSWLEPAPAGSRQSVIIELRNITHGTYYLAMRAVDSAANVGEISNIVEVYLAATTFPTTRSFSTSSVSSPGGVDGSSTSVTGEGTDDKSLSPEVRLSIGLTCGFLFLLLIVGFLLMAFLGRRRRDKTESSRRARLSVLDQRTPKTESSDTLCRSTGGVSVITPVSSWPAGSLLAHYEKTKKNGDVTPQSDLVDDQSIASTKYSYVNRIDQNSSLYDSIYFPPSPEGDELNHPFNPAYVPFNPSYTSSLRRDSHLDQLGVSNNVHDYYNTSTLNGRRSTRLKTDV